jgi:hypothetical protein
MEPAKNNPTNAQEVTVRFVMIQSSIPPKKHNCIEVPHPAFVKEGID